MSNCQVIGIDCPEEDLCERCRGTGTEPIRDDGTDLCCGCDACFDDVIGWCTGIRLGSVTMERARRLVLGERYK